MSLVLCSCSGSNDNTTTENNKFGTPATSSKNKTSASTVPTLEDINYDTNLTAEEITKKLKTSGIPIDNIIVYTEETDENKLLGRPGNYISKTNFADTRLEQLDKNNPSGGTIEVFKNEQDALKRKEYIETVTTGVAFAQQYLILHNNVLLRIENELSTDQAKEYEDKLVVLISNK